MDERRQHTVPRVDRRLGIQERYRRGKRRIIAWVKEDTKALLINRALVSGRSVTCLIEDAVLRAYTPSVPAVLPPKPAGGEQVVPPGTKYAGMRMQPIDRQPPPASRPPDFVEYPADQPRRVPWQI